MPPIGYNGLTLFSPESAAHILILTEGASRKHLLALLSHFFLHSLF